METRPISDPGVVVTEVLPAATVRALGVCPCVRVSVSPRYARWLATLQSSQRSRVASMPPPARAGLSADVLDALARALSGVCCLHGWATAVGDALEGQVIMAVAIDRATGGQA